MFKDILGKWQIFSDLCPVASCCVTPGIRRLKSAAKCQTVASLNADYATPIQQASHGCEAQLAQKYLFTHTCFIRRFSTVK